VTEHYPLDLEGVEMTEKLHHVEYSEMLEGNIKGRESSAAIALAEVT